MVHLLAAVVILSGLIAFAVVLVRCVAFIARGYRDSPIAKLLLLLGALLLFPVWWYFAMRRPYRLTLETAVGFLPLFLLLAALALSALYAGLADRSSSDRWNRFAICGLALLFVTYAVELRALNYTMGPMYEFTYREAEGHFVAAMLGATTVLLGILAVSTILSGKCGTRGLGIALTLILLPLSWSFIIGTFLFEFCGRAHSEITLPESRYRCLTTTRCGEERDYLPILVLDSHGRVSIGNDEHADEAFTLEYLHACIAKMRTTPIDADDPSSVLVPYEPVLILADRQAPVSAILELVETCAHPEFGIWMFDLGVKYPNSECLCTVRLWIEHKSWNRKSTPIRYRRDQHGDAHFWMEDGSSTNLEELTQRVRQSARDQEFPSIRWSIEGDPIWGDFADAMTEVNRWSIDQHLIIEHR